MQQCSHIYSKLNLKQKSMFNRMRFVEIDVNARKKEALKNAYEDVQSGKMKIPKVLRIVNDD